MSVAGTACGGSTPSVETAAQVLAATSKTFAKLHSFHVKGGFIVSSVSDVYLDATVLADGDASGKLTIGSDNANFVVSNGTTYFDRLAPFVEAGIYDPAVAILAERLKGDHWWQTPGSGAVRSSLVFDRESTYVDRFFNGRSKLTEKRQKDSQGRAALKVSDGSVSLFVSVSQPHELLEIGTEAHYLAVDLSSVDLVFDHLNAAATVTAPPSSLTPDMIPPFFRLQSVAFNGDCDPSGCPVKAEVVALAGSGTATLHFTIADSHHRTLATCTGTAKVPATDETATATCHANGAGWRNFWYVGGTYTVDATVDNPDYAS